ncbi:MAG: hypothetical protein ACYC65_14740 [Candidatus Limnocylindrales bacterium]
MNLRIPRDEREERIDRSADQLTAAVLSYGLLVLVVYRSLRGEAAWDLLGLTVLGGVVGTAYRVRGRVVSRRWALGLGLLGVVSAVVAAGLVLAFHP